MKLNEDSIHFHYKRSEYLNECFDESKQQVWEEKRQEIKQTWRQSTVKINIRQNKEKNSTLFFNMIDRCWLDE